MRLQTGVATVILGLGLAGLGSTQPRGTNSPKSVGDLPGGAFLSEAHAVSADGSFVVGKTSSASGEQAFGWTRSQGMAGLGYPQGALASSASDVSADGSVVVGTAEYPGSWLGPKFSSSATGSGGQPGLATVVGVLVGGPVMLSVCAACNRTKH